MIAHPLLRSDEHLPGRVAQRVQLHSAVCCGHCVGGHVAVKLGLGETDGSLGCVQAQSLALTYDPLGRAKFWEQVAGVVV